MSTCGEIGSDVHALIKEIDIRRVEHGSKMHFDESQHLTEGTKVARLRRHSSFGLQQALSFCMRYHLCKQGVALASTRQLRSQGPVSVHAHHTEGVTGPEKQERTNGVGGGIRVGGGNGDGNGIGVGNENGGGGERRNARGNGDESGDVGERDHERERGWRWRPVDVNGMGTGTGAVMETRAVVAEMGTGTETRTGSRRAEERRRCARDRTGVVDVMWKTGET